MVFSLLFPEALFIIDWRDVRESAELLASPKKNRKARTGEIWEDP